MITMILIAVAIALIIFFFVRNRSSVSAEIKNSETPKGIFKKFRIQDINVGEDHRSRKSYKYKMKQVGNFRVFQWVNSFLIICAVCLSGLFYTGCSDYEIASANIFKAAHQFEIFRRVVFYNGITNDYILEVRAFCSITEDTNGRLSVIIKTDEGEYLKHYFGLSDNVTYFCEQMEPKKVSDKHYRVIFKPSVIVPMVEVK